MDRDDKNVDTRNPFHYSKHHCVLEVISKAGVLDTYPADRRRGHSVEYLAKRLLKEGFTVKPLLRGESRRGGHKGDLCCSRCRPRDVRYGWDLGPEGRPAIPSLHRADWSLFS